MPTYDYKCNSCEKEFEYFQSMKDEPLEKCILCEEEGQIKRLISKGSGIIFKGSGFYVNDYKKDKSQPPSSNQPEQKKETKKETKENPKKETTSQKT